MNKSRFKVSGDRMQLATALLMIASIEFIQWQQNMEDGIEKFNANLNSGIDSINGIAFKCVFNDSISGCQEKMNKNKSTNKIEPQIK